MADDADLLISPGFSDAKLAAEVNKVVAKFAAAGKQAQDAFNKTAADTVENSQVVKANAREIERLKRAYDPLYAASKRYEGELEKLNRAHKVGAINAKQHEAALERLNAEYQGGGSAIQKAEGATRNYGGALQQVGFQVGDFATQVGAGTSAAQALGQQLPQLLGAFGTFGALAGAGAAILIPLGVALVRAATDSASLEDRMDELTKSTDAYVSAAEAAATPVDELRAKFGDLADEVARVNETTALIAGAAAKADLGAAAKTFAEQFGGFSTTKLVTEGGLFGSGTVMKEIEETVAAVRRELGLTEAEAIAVVRALRDFQEAGAKGPDAIIKAGSDLNEVLVGIAGSADEAQKRFGAVLAGEDGFAGILEQAAKQVESSVSAQDRAWSELVDKYGQDTETLKSLAGDRETAESALAQAVKDGNAEKVKAAEEYIRAIDREIAKTKEAIAANDSVMQSRIRAYQSYGESRMQSGAITSGAIDTIKQFEGFSAKPYWDVNAYRAGFGSDTVTLADGSVQKVVQGMTVSLTDANRDLVRRVGEFQQGVISKIGGERFDSFTVEQQAALTSIAYNYGSLPDRIVEAVRSGTVADIGNAIGGLAGDNNGINADRRRKEATAFGGGDAAFSAFEAQQKAENDAAKETADALKEQVRERERQLELAKRLSEQLASNLLTEQQSLELDQQRAEQVAAINASDLSDEDKAAAIAAVNAELEKQATVLKLTEEAKRRGVDLDAQMIGSAITYRQAIEALGETQRQQIVNQQQVNAAQEAAAQQQQFMADMQDQLKNGLLDAIIAGESFADVLSNIAQQFARAALEAALFNSGPMAGGGGGGFFGSLLGLFGGGDRLTGALRGAGLNASFEGGGFTGYGSRSGGIDGRGGFPAILHPNETVIDHTRGQSSGGGSMTISVNVAGARGNSEIEDMVRSGVMQGLGEYDRRLPGRVRQVNSDNAQRYD